MAQALRARFASCCQRAHDPAYGTVFESGQGSRLFDVAGNEWIDLTCGFSATNFGHQYPPLLTIAVEQLQRLTHLTSEPHVKSIELAEHLQKRLGHPQHECRVILNTTGARAVETALKACTSFRPGKIVCFSPGFHGRSIATAAISNTARVELTNRFDDPAIVRDAREYPYCSRCPLGLSFPTCSIGCAQELFEYLRSNHERISCVLMEPALGARGYIFPPAQFLSQLCDLCEELDVTVVADEVQTALGRCGDWLLSHRLGIYPDLVVVGKSLGGGITAIAATIGRAEILDSIPAGAESETFAGNPLACSVALGVLNELDSGELFKQADSIGAALRASVKQSFGTCAERLGVRIDGQSACCVVEFQNQQSSTRDSSNASDYARLCLEHRLRVHLSGPLRTRVVMLPPITMSQAELSEALERLNQATNCLLRRL